MASTEVLIESLMICVPITSQSVEEVVNDMHQAKAQGADVVEIRLDHITNFNPHSDLQIILKNKLLPVIFALRPKWGGGLYDGKENMRLEALVELGADFIDIELKAASLLMSMVEHKRNHNSHGKIIVSCYVDGATPPEPELLRLIAQMQATGADIIKLVTNAADITVIARIFSLLPYCQVPLVAYSVGERGLISHLLCPKFGGFFVCGSLAENPIPGLPPLDSLREAYKLERVNVNTKNPIPGLPSMSQCLLMTLKSSLAPIQARISQDLVLGFHTRKKLQSFVMNSIHLLSL